MPLAPGDKTAIALWLAAARYLDGEACLIEEDKVLNAHQAAFAAVNAEALTAKTAITSEKEVAAYLLRVGQDIRQRDATNERFTEFCDELRRLASVLADGNGDGSTCGTGAPIKTCQSGILEVARLVELRVRDLLYAAGISVPEDLLISYVTALTKNGHSCLPFKVSGSADIAAPVRIVDIVIVDGQLSARDVLDIAYILHHELTCHAFQACQSTQKLANAPAKCHWTEGWMDTLAFDATTGWIDVGPAAWVPLQGEMGKGEIWDFHDFRYRAPPYLLPSDLTRRRGAREAFRRLQQIFEEDMAFPAEEARKHAERFSWIANTHAEANSLRLRLLATRLSTLLRNKSRPDVGIKAARDCLAFTAHRNLSRLERELPE
ncbi:hypothetical protein [Rhizobium sp. 007]|uniref:hypothetical protein n=1 Tax=Rhizobium sp. 007 TaxID=2785056 RepID=UPI00188F82F0|nr:hypothetical protein [Rhizobium sp. 007]QPB24571.1 hypothetical protein ISN39_34120 [Rhizobium sp. 007]